MAQPPAAVAAAVPVSHFADVADLGNGKRQMVIHAYPKYYRDGAEFKPAVERFEKAAAPWLAEAVQGVHRIRVKADGTLRMEHLDGAIVQRLRAIAAVNKAGRVVRRDTIDLSAWAVALDGNRVVWTSPEGWTYEAVYTADQAITRLTIPAARQAAIRKRAPAEAFAIGPVSEWDESGLGPDWACAQGDAADTEGQIAWTWRGKRVQSIKPALVGAHPKRRIRSRKDAQLIEAIPASALDGKAVLVFNDSVTYQQGADGYAGCADTYMSSRVGRENYNYGITTTNIIGAETTNRYFRALQRWDLTALAGNTISAATLSLYNSDSGTTTQSGTVQAYAVLPANTGWVQGTKNAATAGAGEACWNYKLYDTTAWAGSVGCGTSGTDYNATQLGSGNWTDGVAGWIDIALTASVVNGWIAGANDGILLRAATEWSNGYFMLFVSAEGTAANRPKLALTYAATPAGGNLPVLDHHRRQQEN